MEGFYDEESGQVLPELASPEEARAMLDHPDPRPQYATYERVVIDACIHGPGVANCGHPDCVGNTGFRLVTSSLCPECGGRRGPNLSSTFEKVCLCVRPSS